MDKFHGTEGICNNNSSCVSFPASTNTLGLSIRLTPESKFDDRGRVISLVSQSVIDRCKDQDSARNKTAVIHVLRPDWERGRPKIEGSHDHQIYVGIRVDGNSEVSLDAPRPPRKSSPNVFDEFVAGVIFMRSDSACTVTVEQERGCDEVGPVLPGHY